MSTNDDDGLGLRTVTPLSSTHGDGQMNAIGWLMFAIMAVVLLPLLPVIAVLWLVSKVISP